MDFSNCTFNLKWYNRNVRKAKARFKDNKIDLNGLNGELKGFEKLYLKHLKGGVINGKEKQSL
jgi:hypothetical protein